MASFHAVSALSSVTVAVVAMLRNGLQTVLYRGKQGQTLTDLMMSSKTNSTLGLK